MRSLSKVYIYLEILNIMLRDWSKIEVSLDARLIDASRFYVVKVVKELCNNPKIKQGVSSGKVEEIVKKELKNRNFAKCFFLGHGDYDPIKGWEWISIKNVLEGMYKFGILECNNQRDQKSNLIYKMTPLGEQLLKDKSEELLLLYQ